MRESTNYPGDYTLCVSCDGKVEHYRIMYHASKLSIDEEVYFENLMQLVEVSWPPPAALGGDLGVPHSLHEPVFPHTSMGHLLCAREVSGPTVPSQRGGHYLHFIGQEMKDHSS